LKDVSTKKRFYFMKKIYFLGLLFLSILNLETINAQQFKRHVISSLGTNHIMAGSGNAVACTAITLGQPPNAGTIESGTASGGILRQGFQQPNSEICKINISMDVTETNNLGCGVYYVFEYTGDIDTATEISWQFGNQASPIIATGPVSPKVGFAEIGDQSISITVSNGTCQKTVSKIFTATGTPFLALSSKVDALCYGEKGSIDLMVKNATAPTTYLWSSGQATEDLTGLNPGKYSYTVVDSKGCTAMDTVEIIGSTQPLILNPHVLDEICDSTHDGSIELNLLNGSQPVTFTWDDGNTSANRDSLATGIYKVTIEDAFGCKIDTMFNVRTFCDLTEEDFIPDVFSPNSDGFNDAWNVAMLERFPLHTVKIFNRWGHLIWTSPPGGFIGWDGTNQDNNEMPIGAYFYVIELNDDSKKIFKASVTIIR
jgi:gliding motility-associated-like protein